MEEKREPAKSEREGKAGEDAVPPTEDAARGEPSLLPEGNALPDQEHRPEKPSRTSAA